MAIELVKAFFRGLGRESDVLEFPVSSATVALAAEALHTDPARIAKTLSFMTADGPVLIIAAGDARIDNQKFKAQFSCKAKFLTPEEVEQATGHAVGGVCPFALASPVPVFVDQSVKRFDTVFPACGSANSAIELHPEEFFALCPGAQWTDVCKLPD